MTSLDLWTWIAIGVLVLGAAAVFVWFLVDVRKVLGGGAAERRR